MVANLIDDALTGQGVGQLCSTHHHSSPPSPRYSSGKMLAISPHTELRKSKVACFVGSSRHAKLALFESNASAVNSL